MLSVFKDASELIWRATRRLLLSGWSRKGSSHKPRSLSELHITPPRQRAGTTPGRSARKQKADALRLSGARAPQPQKLKGEAPVGAPERRPRPAPRNKTKEARPAREAPEARPPRNKTKEARPARRPP